MGVKVVLTFSFALCCIELALCVTRSHMFNQMALISDLVDSVDFDQGDVETLLSYLRDIEAKIKPRANIKGKHESVDVAILKDKDHSHGVYTKLDIIQKAFKAEKEINTRIRTDQLEMNEKLSDLKFKAGKCELTSAFSVIQTSLQLLNTSQHTSQETVVNYLAKLENTTQQTLLTITSLVNVISNNNQECGSGGNNASNKASKVAGDVGYRADTKPMSCKDIDSDKSGVYTLYPKFKPSGLQVYCDMLTDGGGWVVFQRRKDGFTDFNRDWQQYKNGFGDLSWEFWLGNDNLHGFTFERPSEIRVDLIDQNGNRGYAKYALFKIGSEKEGYQLFIDGYSGNCGDSLTYHKNMKFTTKDKDNDPHEGNCAVSYSGPWWHNKCHYSNLNGDYFESSSDGLAWYYWHNSYTTVMKFTEMKVRWKY